VNLEAAPPSSSRIVLKTGRGSTVLSLDRIQYISAANTCSEVVTIEGSFNVRENLTSMARKLPGDRFVRVSRFTVVNLAHIASVRPKSHGDQYLFLRSGVQIMVSRTHRARVMDLLRQGC